MKPQPTIDAMSIAARTLNSGDVRQKLHAVQLAQDALDGIKAALLIELSSTKDYEIDGASTLNMWVRTQLRMSSTHASILVRNATAMRDLPLVADAALKGLINASHVQAFAFGLKHVGLEIMLTHEEAFMQTALANDPGELFEGIVYLKDLLHPEDLDDKWRKGMDKEDFAVDSLPDGFHVTGFLNTVTGAKLKKVLDSVSAPDGKDDDRTGAQRRVQGLDDVLSAILGSGLPSDKGVTPHMSVFVDADTLAAAAERVAAETQDPYLRPPPMPDVKPATLAGHGHIGPHLLMYFFCISDFTALLMKQGGGDRQAQILNAGTAKYAPTLLQRRAVLARQTGVCATPGCHHTHLEIHHVIWWSKGGSTDLDMLIGLCVRCHHLLHRGRLHIAGDAVEGFTFTNRDGRNLRRRRTTNLRHAA